MFCPKLELVANINLHEQLQSVLFRNISYSVWIDEYTNYCTGHIYHNCLRLQAFMRLTKTHL